jgi:hypothetical protein
MRRLVLLTRPKTVGFPVEPSLVAGLNQRMNLGEPGPPDHEVEFLVGAASDDIRLKLPMAISGS